LPALRRHRCHCSERDVVVEISRRACPGRRRRTRAATATATATATAAAGLARIACLLRGATAATAAAAQHLHFAGHHLGGVAIIALLVLPLARLQATLDVDLRTLAQVFGRDLAEAVPHDHGVPLGLLLLFAGGLVRPALAGGDADVGDGGAARGGAGFRILPQVADENDLVDAACHERNPC